MPTLQGCIFFYNSPPKGGKESKDLRAREENQRVKTKRREGKREGEGMEKGKGKKKKRRVQNKRKEQNKVKGKEGQGGRQMRTRGREERKEEKVKAF